VFNHTVQLFTGYKPEEPVVDRNALMECDNLAKYGYWAKNMARKIPFVREAIDIGEELNKAAGINKLPRWGRIAYNLVGPTGNKFDLIDALMEKDNNGNKGTKQVQRRTSKYKGHYHVVYGDDKRGTGQYGTTGAGSKRYKYSGKYNKKRVK